MKKLFACLLATGLLSSSPSYAGWDSLWTWVGGGAQGTAPTDELPPELQGLTSFPTLVATLQEFYANMLALHALAQATGMQTSAEDMVWQDLLGGKVIKQWQATRSLLIAITGGTKTGKSMTANHLAGREVSQSHHLGGHTKQIVLTVPPNLADLDALSILFPNFEVKINASAGDGARATGATTQLLVQSLHGMPPDIMIADTPDVDSDIVDNWEKAYAAARLSDVIIAMITPQKHSDHSIIKFYQRVAADANKPVVVVINNATPKHLRNKEWKDWLRVFCEKTGIRPFQAYVVPQELEEFNVGDAKFLRVTGDVTNPGAANLELETTPSHMGQELGKLNVARIKAESQIGSLLNALNGGQDGKGGILKYLAMVKERSGVFQRTLDNLRDGSRMSQVEWPAPPVPIIMREVSKWWDDNNRWQVTKTVIGVMNIVTLASWGASKQALKEDNLGLTYRLSQHRALETAVQIMMDSLDPVVEPAGNYLSLPSRALIAAQARTAMLQTLKPWFDEHHGVDKDFARVAGEILPDWTQNNPGWTGFLQVADVAGNVVIKPAVTVGTALATVAASVGGGSLAHMVSASAQNLVQTALVGGSSGVVSGRVTQSLSEEAAAKGIQLLFQDLAVRYSTLQVQAVSEWIRTHYLVNLLAELERGAKLGQAQQLAQSQRCAGEIGQFATWLSAKIAEGKAPAVP